MAEPKMLTTWDGFKIHAEKANSDVNGNSLELTIEDEKVKAIGNIPVGGGDESVWTDETFNALGDDNGGNILDENDEAIGDEDAETLWATRDGVGFKAERAEADINGNSLELHVNAEGKIDKIGDKYIEGTGEAPVDAYSKEETNALLDDKVDKVSGKGLSANDYTDTDKDKLDNIESGAQVNVIEHVKIGQNELTVSEKAVSLPSFTGTTPGLVPESTQADSSKLLQSNGTWAEVQDVDLVEVDVDSLETVSNKVTSFSNPTDTQYPSAKLVSDQLATKVTSVSGKGLSTEDYTTAEKTKLSGIAEGAQVNVIETIKKGDTALSVTNKTVTLPEPSVTYNSSTGELHIDFS